MIRIAAIGPRTVDLIDLPGSPTIRRTGGAPHYAARALRFAGAEPVVMETPGEVISRLRHTELGTEQSLDRVADPVTPAWLAERLPQLEGCAWIVLGPQSAGDFPPEVLRAVAATGIPSLLDCQGPSRGAEPGPVRLREFPLDAILGVTALKLNEIEARALTGSDDPAALATLEVPEVLLSLGPRGAISVAGGTIAEVPAATGDFDDPTGAGDSLGALYALGRARGEEPAAAAQFAVRGVEELYST